MTEFVDSLEGVGWGLVVGYAVAQHGGLAGLLTLVLGTVFILAGPLWRIGRYKQEMIDHD